MLLCFFFFRLSIRRLERVWKYKLLDMRLFFLLAQLVIVTSDFNPVNGLVCLKCNDIWQPRHCHYVARCNADEACFTTWSHISQRYQLGCLKRSSCPNGTSNSSKTCDECCSNSLCNANGCGETGYPASRGPVCYDCDYHNDQHPCTTIDICSTGEECSIKGRSEFGDQVFSSGCKLKYICQSESAGPSAIIGKRSVQTVRSSSTILCNECCSHDLCNLNCSVDPCHSSPCQHGLCFSNGSSFLCHCQSGWLGSTCQQPDHCVSSPCVNGACVNEPQGFHCQCPNGTYGTVCENVDHCLSSPCIHGTCSNNQTLFVCKCFQGWNGSACDTITYPAFDCLDVQHRGIGHTDGVYSVRLNKSREIIKVYCDMTSDGGGWTVFQKRFNGSVDFYRKFSDYDNGFGSVYGEFWLGLKYVYQMTVGVVNELRIDLENVTGNTAYEVYQDFSISGYPLYTLHIGTDSGTAGDGGRGGLSYNNGYPFSTYDKIQGSSYLGCPALDHGSWWYHYCSIANLNGEYITPGTVHTSNGGEAGVVYYKWTGGVSLKSTEMKFRRK